MKRILLLVASSFATLALAGCAVSPSMLGGNVAGMVGVGSTQDPGGIGVNRGLGDRGLGADTMASPDLTGSIVPLGAEGEVVDLPSAGDQVVEQLEEPGQEISSQERHRRELVNRGDLQEGEALPVE